MNTCDICKHFDFKEIPGKYLKIICTCNKDALKFTDFNVPACSEFEEADDE